MAKKKNRDRSENSEGGSGKFWKFSDLKSETRQGVFAIIASVFTLFFILAAFDKAGFLGEKTYGLLHYLLGAGYFLLPLLGVMLAISLFKSLDRHFDSLQAIGALIFFLSGLGIVELVAPGKGGEVGSLIASPIYKLFDLYAGLIILAALLVISLFIIFDTNLLTHFGGLWQKLFNRNKKEKVREMKIIGGENLEDEEVGPESDSDEDEESENDEDEEVATQIEKPKKLKVKGGEEADSVEGIALTPRHISFKKFVPIPLSLLETDKGKPGVGDIKANANIIKRTLQNFGITVEMDEISIGPSVTRYSLKPAEGVKLSRIVALNNDLSLALAAHPIRIEAPIPGKSLVGIEIPNSIKSTVGLATLLSSPDFQTSEKPLMVSLGKGISGISHFANLAKMPHLLIAGATGSGKSVTIHAIITSLLFRNSPENMKLILIDPKRVELTLYNKIPHLLTPVITDPKKAILALKWAAKEMDRRYDILESESVRDIDSYHKTVLMPEMKKLEKRDGEVADGEKLPEPMPYIAIVIDELADIMTSYPRELESAIVRLAQMSRAVGIHLILSTQRPSVNVITGLIKANVPARIALQVSSQIDSRTILDTGGAEKLLGAGDMLYLSGEMSKPARIQSAFISETEVKKVVKFLAQSYETEIPQDITAIPGQGNGDSLIFSQVSFNDEEALEDDDELYEQAREEVLHAGKASTSYIQRKLRVGYARAARLMDILEERGVIGPADGAKPREVLIGKSEEADFGKTPEDSSAPKVEN
ncbi:MAG: DNA translocase FtsK 4TM domain-containing protein [Candidatus Paceibacterota bacterium]|jgi:S-DNA-T family DNA segregation ATPase FtsK/SpoIIIE